MGQNEIILITLFAVPVLALLVLRANAALVFLSMCLGYTVGRLLGGDISAFADTLMPGLGRLNMQLGLIAIPALLTALFYTRSVKGMRALSNIVPALAVGCLAVALVVPLLGPPVSAAVMALPLWQTFARLESLAIGGGAAASLLFLWLQRPVAGKKSDDKRGS